MLCRSCAVKNTLLAVKVAFLPGREEKEIQTDEMDFLSRQYYYSTPIIIRSNQVSVLYLPYVRRYSDPSFTLRNIRTFGKNKTKKEEDYCVS